MTTVQVTPAEVTALLHRWSEGEADALEHLMPLVVDELRQLARSYFRHEAAGHTLQPTALVNEVYMRLVDQRQVRWDNRAQFFAFAATLMRRILVDHAKARKTAKRGGGQRPLPLDEALGVALPPEVDMVALDGALEALARFDARGAHIVELRYFVGLTLAEVAEVLEVSPTTVKRDWNSARLWLARELKAQ